MRESGSGGKAGEAELWLNKEQVEPVEPLMVIAIVSIPLPYTPT